jgi:hypothetical protein
MCTKINKAVPSSPNLSPAFAASWNGVPLEDDEITPDKRLFNSLPCLQVSDQDLIDWFCEEKNLITTCIQLFNKNTVSKILWFSADFSKIKDLLAMVG